jgi:hypothetical protein
VALFAFSCYGLFLTGPEFATASRRITEKNKLRRRLVIEDIGAPNEKVVLILVTEVVLVFFHRSLFLSFIPTTLLQPGRVI